MVTETDTRRALDVPAVGVFNIGIITKMEITEYGQDPECFGRYAGN